jgi:hypothetical protein
MLRVLGTLCCVRQSTGERAVSYTQSQNHEPLLQLLCEGCVLQRNTSFVRAFGIVWLSEAAAVSFQNDTRQVKCPAARQVLEALLE